MATKIDDFIKRVELTAEEDLFTPRTFYHLSSSMFCEMCELLKEREAIKPTINEDGEAFCVCGENVGIIPSSKNLPSIRSKYCSKCGRRMTWE